MDYKKYISLQQKRNQIQNDINKLDTFIDFLIKSINIKERISIVISILKEEKSRLSTLKYLNEKDTLTSLIEKAIEDIEKGNDIEKKELNNFFSSRYIEQKVTEQEEFDDLVTLIYNSLGTLTEDYNLYLFNFLHTFIFIDKSNELINEEISYKTLVKVQNILSYI
jgi:hypothetical protein